MTRLERWERRAEVPLILLVGFLVAYAWPVIDTSINRDLRSFFTSGGGYLVVRSRSARPGGT